MDKGVFYKIQIIELKRLLSICENHPFMAHGLKDKIKELEDKLWQLQTQDHTTEK